MVKLLTHSTDRKRMRMQASDLADLVKGLNGSPC